MCPLCGQDIGEDVLAAADVIYGLKSEGFKDHLTESLKIAARNVDALLATKNLTQPLKEQAVGEAAVLHALGLADFNMLARAYNHYGDSYECRQ